MVKLTPHEEHFFSLNDAQYLRQQDIIADEMVNWYIKTMKLHGSVCTCGKHVKF